MLDLKEGIKVILGKSPRYELLSYLPDIFRDATERGEEFNIIDLRFDKQIIVSE